MVANLPADVTSFIGREQELTAVEHLLNGTRLLTLTGIGGCGKTRLALKVASERAQAYANGVTLVELVPLTDPALVPAAVLAGFGLREERGRSILDTLIGHLSSRSCLLVIDNCEHVLDAVAHLVAVLLRECGSLHVLATSRQPLGITGETVWRVPPMTVLRSGLHPLRGTERTIECENGARNLNQCDAVRLFVDRATAANPEFRLTERNDAAVLEICRRLDGIPLAIELAAARVRTLTVEQIAERLDDRFHLLTNGSRTAAPRQQTLRDTLDWSFELLTEPEQVLLRRLAMFVGGCTLEAAEQVCGNGDRAAGSDPPTHQVYAMPPADVLDLLSGLVDKSLVVVEEEGGASRYRLLETVRQYGFERLEASGESECARSVHAWYYLGIAEEAQQQIHGPQGKGALDRFEADHDNFRAALTWWSEHDPACALRLGAAMWEFWETRGHIAEGYQRLSSLVAVSERAAPSPALAKVLSGHSLFARIQGDLSTAHDSAVRCLAVRRALNDPAGIADALTGLGIICRAQGRYEDARRLHEEGLRLLQGTDDRWNVAKALNHLGNALERLGDYTAARERHEAALAIRRELGDLRSVAQSLDNLGVVAYQQGDFRRAQALHEEALAIKRELGDPWSAGLSMKSLGDTVFEQGDVATARGLIAESMVTMWWLCDREAVAECMEGLAGVVAAQRAPTTAAQLLGAAASLREGLGIPLDESDRFRYQRNAAVARAQLGREAFTLAFTEGRSMPIEQVISLALTEAVPRGSSDRKVQRASEGLLSAREYEVAVLIAQGQTNRQIAEQLVVATSTVDRHVVNILRKLNLSSRAQVAAWVVEHQAAAGADKLLHVQPERIHTALP